RDLRRLARGDVENVEGTGVVGEADLLAVRRPLRLGVGAGAVDADLARRSLAVLVADVEQVLAAAVGEPGDRLPVGRPRRPALVRRGGVGQVAVVAFLARHGEDLAAELDGGARPRGGDRAAAALVLP